MPIIATDNSKPRELIPAGNYVARCYMMIEIGTVTDVVMGDTVVQRKVRLGWELPNELKVFEKDKGEQPLVISKEYTLSMHEKSNLRAMLKSWRGQDFTPEEAKHFDITKLLGKACMLNIIHKPGKSDPTKLFQEIASITAMPKGMVAPKQINPSVCLSYDNFDEVAFNKLPEFIRNRMTTTPEYLKLSEPQVIDQTPEEITEPIDDLPF